MRYRRDIQALRAAPPRIVIAVGTTSKGQLANRTEVALAGQLGTSVVEFPGDPRRIRGRVLDRVLTETP
jgi:clorobiocin biosynthesis protein CloN7